jgi:hypothetical protein
LKEEKLSVDEKPRGDGLSEALEPSSVAGAIGLDAPVSPAIERFRSCRWRKAQENGSPECCGHRDVLPLTGASGFDASAWCPDCGYFKLRRTPKKREDYGFRY